ncbi:MAG: SprT-like domain-containing protein [Winkia neuii]|uniref:M48 family peptidase n=1 Tax=Winkia neuii TaxID=33007 RepID=A0A2I1IQ45_9ACTO|nr:SprT-like domain-containing protein [Winkia neuii]OFK01967.1 hypothetical protein HMPREF2835_08060 [Actinomyces sp. HMSC072A03]OFT54537.1 hypothetical protein HMPREF3152_08655 [Actinomyces sp. HMSC06A08]MDK8098751.1 SprT-like domain-containing protein [Winkia neuii]MDU3134113.1 SprT-like domain-containing protein [Winkia neuii]PKY73245.1 M48 family peptidase [Winkia neuii]
MKIETALGLARAILREHGLNWQVRPDRARRRAGACHHSKKLITLSAALLPLYEDQQVRDVILHEVAHALAGARAGHGPKWQKIARQIGARPKATLPASLPSAPAAWIGRCPAGHETARYRRPSRVVSCGICSRTFTPEAVLTWYFHGREVAPSALGNTYARQLARLRRTNI